MYKKCVPVTVSSQLGVNAIPKELQSPYHHGPHLNCLTLDHGLFYTWRKSCQITVQDIDKVTSSSLRASGSCQTSSGILKIYLFKICDTPNAFYLEGKRCSLRYWMCWQGIDNHWPFQFVALSDMVYTDFIYNFRNGSYVRKRPNYTQSR